jgi:hypothetical protein
MLLDYRKAEFRTQFEKADWEKIKSQAYCFEEEGQILGSNIIASYMDTPSGKIYAPFANSNVDACAHCHGDGLVKNLNGDAFIFEKATRDHHAERNRLVLAYGPHYEGKWPEGCDTLAKWLDALAKASSPDLPCPFCGGLGSEEAALDQCWNEALEEVAEENGGWISHENGDVFFVQMLADEGTYLRTEDDETFTWDGEVVATSETLREYLAEQPLQVWEVNKYDEARRVEP